MPSPAESKGQSAPLCRELKSPSTLSRSKSRRPGKTAPCCRWNGLAGIKRIVDRKQPLPSLQLQSSIGKGGRALNTLEFTTIVGAGSLAAGCLGALTGLGGGVVIVPMLVL